MPFEEYKLAFEEYLSDTGQVWLHSFYRDNKNFRPILLDLRYSTNTSKRFQGFSQEELVILTPSNYLKIIIKGSDRETRRYCSSVIKIDFNQDALTT